jgi:hypothetical protein
MGMQVGAVMVLGTVVSILIVDGHIFENVGRRALLIAGGIVISLRGVPPDDIRDDLIDE